MPFLKFMTRTDGSPLIYLLKAFALTIIGEIVIILVQLSFFPASPQSSSDEPVNVSAFGILILWPLFSTCVVWAAITGFKRISPTYWHAAAGSAFAIAALFVLITDISVALVLAWPFFIYALTFLAWQLKSTLHGFAMTAVLQGMVSLLPAMLIGS